MRMCGFEAALYYQADPVETAADAKVELLLVSDQSANERDFVEPTAEAA